MIILAVCLLVILSSSLYLNIVLAFCKILSYLIGLLCIMNIVFQRYRDAVKLLVNEC